MKKLIFLVAALLLQMPCLLAQAPGNSLSGTVIDSASGKPLTGVSVFLNNTSLGTVTRADGSFLLKGIPQGTHQIVFSAIGYATAVADINGSRLPPSIKAILHPRATELEAVTVEPNDKHGWSKWGEFFLVNFIGTGGRADSCSIRNRRVLRFHFNKKSRRLTVTATEPLIIENNALGYILTYKLEQFTFDMKSNIVIYLGFPYFQEMSTKRPWRREEWLESRSDVYSASVMHYMRSLYAGHTIEEGFFAERKITMRQPNITTKMVIVPPDSILAGDEGEYKDLFFEGPLTVLYGVGDTTKVFHGSEMRLMNAVRIRVEDNGHFFPPQELLFNGYWAQSEKISNLLPLDYVPRPKMPIFPTIH